MDNAKKLIKILYDKSEKQINNGLKWGLGFSILWMLIMFITLYLNSTNLFLALLGAISTIGIVYSISFVFNGFTIQNDLEKYITNIKNKKCKELKKLM